MKHFPTFVSALAGLSLSFIAPSLIAGGDGTSRSSKNPVQRSGKEVVVESRSSGKEVVVEPRTSGKEVVVESRSSGKEVVVKQQPSSGKEVMVDPTSGGMVAGRVFDDASGDGAKQADETYLANIRVRLLRNEDDEQVAMTSTDVRGIYIFEDIVSGQYRMEYNFGEDKQIFSRPFAVNYDQPSIIVEPVPYFRGFDFSLVPAVKIHRVYTPVELKSERTPPIGSEPPPTTSEPPPTASEPPPTTSEPPPTTSEPPPTPNQPAASPFRP